MRRSIPENLFHQLALAVAAGRKVASWCEESGVKPRTAYSWCQREAFQRLVQRYRRRAEDRAIGMMAQGLDRAVERIVQLIEKGRSDAVTLSAAKTLIDKLLVVQSHAERNDEVRQLDERLKAQEKRRETGPGDLSGTGRPA
jgi:hypothetical protein